MGSSQRGFPVRNNSGRRVKNPQRRREPTLRGCKERA
jgi:hypothetical protein